MNRTVHFEILSPDPESSAAFYRSVFGWEIASWPGPQSYWLITAGDTETPGIDGGLMERHFEQPVINTVGVVDLEGMIDRVKSAGGKLVMGPHEIEGVGRHAYCSDPDGTLFGIMQFTGTPGA